MGEFKHISVMPMEVVNYLDVKPDGIYVDGTLGGGGHSSLILKKLTTGKLIGVDQDETAIKAATLFLRGHENFIPIHGSFHDLGELLTKKNISKIDGVLLDLGVSSHQIDTPERGFSFRFDGPLDMRMDSKKSLTAADIVNLYDEKEIADILFNFGEERYSRKIAREICIRRKEKPFLTTLDLADFIERTSSYSSTKTKNRIHPATRSFMALRIAVNDELAPLENAIREIIPFLNSSGVFSIITFHSLEDRIVKKTFKNLESPCICPRDIPYCVCSNKPSVKVITRKPILPSEEELEFNSRAHSAKLRIAKKL